MTRAMKNVCGIQQESTGYWWQCNGEHGAGWTKRIRQAWTHRRANIEYLRMIERGLDVADIRIIELGPMEGADRD